jgi:hypothetical protein
VDDDHWAVKIEARRNGDAIEITMRKPGGAVVRDLVRSTA